MRVHRKVFLSALAVLVPFAAAPMITEAQDTRDYGTPALLAFAPDELDNLVAPIALYPDAILAQLLVASTFPEQVDVAARYVRANGTRGIDDQSWDVSVKSIAHYPPVLNMLAEREDWAVALGQAYAAQSGDVMDAVQRLRRMARANGNLESTTQQAVVVDANVIRIEPAQPRVIYVPTYDPEIVYYRPVRYVSVPTVHFSFGIGFPIGSWLIYDCDWYGRRVFYDGWHGGGWRVAAYPFVFINRVYVHPRHHVVVVNRHVVHRTVNYVNLRRYTTVHRNVSWDERGRARWPGNRTAQVRDDRDRRNDDVRGRDDSRGRDDARGRDDVRGREAQPRVTERAPAKMSLPTREERPTRVAPPTREAPTRVAPPAREAPTRVSPPARTAPPTRAAPPIVRKSEAVRATPPGAMRKATVAPPARQQEPSRARASAPPVAKSRPSAPPSRAPSKAQASGGSSRGKAVSQGGGKATVSRGNGPTAKGKN